MTDPPPTATDPTRDAAISRLRELEAALVAQGFAVRIEEKRWSLIATNEAAKAVDPSPLAVAYGPVRLNQRVQIAVDEAHEVAWYWQWSGPTRDAPGEYEYIAPLADVKEVARRMALVLALAPPTP
jgi:hypothetical protein